jgi:hypothetical protein
MTVVKLHCVEVGKIYGASAKGRTFEIHADNWLVFEDGECKARGDGLSACQDLIAMMVA